MSHRLYDLEVIELSEDVSFIMVLPPSDSVCNVPGNQDMLTQRPGYVTLPVKLFEMGECWVIERKCEKIKLLGQGQHSLTLLFLELFLDLKKLEEKGNMDLPISQTI